MVPVALTPALLCDPVKAAELNVAEFNVAELKVVLRLIGIPVPIVPDATPGVVVTTTTVAFAATGCVIVRFERDELYDAMTD